MQTNEGNFANKGLKLIIKVDDKDSEFFQIGRDMKKNGFEVGKDQEYGNEEDEDYNGERRGLLENSPLSPLPHNRPNGPQRSNFFAD